jgi:hypothetical protein
MLDPIELSYDLHLLPLGRFTFRRWRYELWHGPRLLSAGWRLSAHHAQRALRAHALGYAHRVHGLSLLHADHGHEVDWGAHRVALRAGDLSVTLVHRAVQEAT